MGEQGDQARCQDEPSVLLTALNVPLICEVMAEMVAMSPTVINPSITAYSTAVGPDSLVRKRFALNITPRIACFPPKILAKLRPSLGKSAFSECRTK
jgi:hypothetical protein